MRESIFQSEWKNSWYHHFPTCHYVKIPDMPHTAGARFLPPKPYDCYAILNGEIYVMELKLKTKPTGFPFGDITELQINNLLEASKQGANAWVVINYRIQKLTDKQKKKHGLSDNRFDFVFIVGIENFMLLDRQISDKSIPFRYFVEVIKPKIKKEGEFWDIPSCLNWIKEFYN